MQHCRLPIGMGDSRVSGFHGTKSSRKERQMRQIIGERAIGGVVQFLRLGNNAPHFRHLPPVGRGSRCKAIGAVEGLQDTMFCQDGGTAGSGLL